MRLALIPPRGMEELALRSNFHLALAHITHSDYLRTYGVAAKRGDFIVMDNGVAEGQLISTKNLMVAAQRLGAHELVIPDVLGDARATRTAIEEFLTQAYHMPKAYHSAEYFAVAQGSNLGEVRDLVSWLAPQMSIRTVGIPRLLMKMTMLSARIDLANWIEDTFPGRFKIHLLGANSLWPREIVSVCKYAPHVRSIDTSMPFAYAMAGERLDVKYTAKISRPPQYFEIPHDKDCTDLIHRNIHTMLGWVNAEAPVS